MYINPPYMMTNLPRNCSRHATHRTHITYSLHTDTHIYTHTHKPTLWALSCSTRGRGEQACELRLNGDRRSSIGLVSLRKPIIPANERVQANGKCCWFYLRFVRTASSAFAVLCCVAFLCLDVWMISIVCMRRFCRLLAHWGGYRGILPSPVPVALCVLIDHHQFYSSWLPVRLLDSFVRRTCIQFQSVSSRQSSATVEFRSVVICAKTR